MNPSELAEMLKVLSAEMRVRIMMTLQGGRLCAGAISRRLGASPSSTSQHLKILKAAGLVSASRIGNYIHYSVDRKALARVLSAVDGLLPPAVYDGDERTATSVCGQDRDGEE